MERYVAPGGTLFSYPPDLSGHMYICGIGEDYEICVPSEDILAFYKELLSLGKICTKCGGWHPFKDFTKSSKHKDGLHSICKPCKRAIAREYRNEHLEQERERTRRWAKKNYDYLKEKRKLRWQLERT